MVKVPCRFVLTLVVALGAPAVDAAGLDGTYELKRPNECAPVANVLQVKCDDAGCETAKFELDSYSCKPLDAPRIGTFSGRIELRSNVGLFVGGDDQEGCFLVFDFRRGKAMDIMRYGDCYFGAGAAPEGRYFKVKEK